MPDNYGYRIEGGKSAISENRTLIMGISMLSIMLFHQPWFFGHGIDNFFYYYGYWGVDFFLFVSGFGIAHSLEKNTLGHYCRNRITRLLPYCLVFGALRAILYYNGIHGFTPKFHPSVGLVACSLDLWYIEAILIFYSLAPLFKKITDHMPFVAFFFSVLICLTIRTIDKPDFFNDYLLLKRGH